MIRAGRHSLRATLVPRCFTHRSGSTLSGVRTAISQSRLRPARRRPNSVTQSCSVRFRAGSPDRGSSHCHSPITATPCWTTATSSPRFARTCRNSARVPGGNTSSCGPLRKACATVRVLTLPTSSCCMLWTSGRRSMNCSTASTKARRSEKFCALNVKVWTTRSGGARTCCGSSIDCWFSRGGGTDCRRNRSRGSRISRRALATHCACG